MHLQQPPHSCKCGCHQEGRDAFVAVQQRTASVVAGEPSLPRPAKQQPTPCRGYVYPAPVPACRWKEAHDAGKAPPVYLSGCHIRSLDYIDLDVLKQYAVDETEMPGTTEL